MDNIIISFNPGTDASRLKVNMNYNLKELSSKDVIPILEVLISNLKEKEKDLNSGEVEG